MKIKLKVRKIFFPIYNGVRFFFQHYTSWAIFALLIIYLPFQCRILFFPGYFLASLFPLEISLQDIFFGLKSPTTPQKWIGRPLKSTKRLLSRLILICQSLLKPFATIGNKTLQESGRIRFYLPGEWKNSFLLTSTRRVRNFLGWMTNFFLLWVYARTEAPLLTGSSS